MTTVKTFDDKKVSQLIKECDPYLKQYIKAQKNIIDSGHNITSKAISKIRELSKQNKTYQEGIERYIWRFYKGADRKDLEALLPDNSRYKP